MKKEDGYRFLKLLCVAFSVILLLAACGKSEGGVPEEGSSPVAGSTESADEKADVQSGATFGAGASCWQGDLVYMFYRPLGNMVNDVYSSLSLGDVMPLMALVFSLWMAFQILRHVSSPSPESMGEFWTSILRKGTLCFACGYLASSTENIMYVLNTFVFPIYVTLLEFCSRIMDVVNNVGKNELDARALELPSQDPDEVKHICEVYANNFRDEGCRIQDTSKILMSKDKFPEEPMQMMSCMTCAVGSRLNVGYHVAMHVMGTGLFGFIVGCFLLAAFTITKLGFSLYLIDSIFRLDMMVIIAPFLILFYPFEQTRKWTGVGFKIILNSSAIMLCMGVMVSMTIAAMQVILADSDMNLGDVDLYNNFGVVPLSLVFLGFVVIKTSGLAVSLAESITGGSGDTRFQKKMAAVVGTVAKGLLLIATAGAGKAVTAVVEHSARMRALAEKVRKAQAQAQKIQSRMRHLAGRDNNNGEQE